MHTVTSFHSSAVARPQVRAIMAEYLALERARVLRRLLSWRFGLLAAVAAVLGFGFHRLSLFASWLSVGVCILIPLWAWVIELRCDRRLAQRLGQTPGDEKVIKSP